MHFRQSGIRVDRTGLSVGGAEVCLGIIVSDTILQLVATSASGARQPTMGQRLEDARPEGQNLAQPCLVHDSRTPSGQAQSGYTVNRHRTTRQEVSQRPREVGFASIPRQGLGENAPGC